MFTRLGDNGTCRTGVWVSDGMTFHARLSGKASEEPEFLGDPQARERLDFDFRLVEPVSDPSPTLNTVRTKPS